MAFILYARVRTLFHMSPQDQLRMLLGSEGSHVEMVTVDRSCISVSRVSSHGTLREILWMKRHL